MQKIAGKLTVFYENPFWVAVYERMYAQRLEVSKVVFGAEPKDYEIYHFFNQNWTKLSFSPLVEDYSNHEKRMNPKRIKRAVSSLLTQKGIGTKAQQALKLQREKNKQERICKSRLFKQEEKQRHFQLLQQKKKEKHRGR